MPGSVDFFSVLVDVPGQPVKPVAYQVAHREAYLSANVRLAGHAKMAHLRTRSVAERYADAVLPILQKRYGDSAEAIVIECNDRDSEKVLQRIDSDTALVEWRLATKDFNPKHGP